MHPIQALRERVVGGVIVRGEVIDEGHDACRAGAALAAGDRHLGRKAAARQSTWRGCNAVFAVCDGSGVWMNS